MAGAGWKLHEEAGVTSGSGTGVDEDVLIRPARGRRDPHAASDLILGMTEPMLSMLASESGAREIPLRGLGLSRVYEVRPGQDAPRLTLAGPFLAPPTRCSGWRS